MRKQRITVLIVALLICLLCPLNALAVGEGNIDGGGGGLGSGSSTSYWNSGNEGVRVTVVRSSDHSVVTTPIDFTNKKPPAGLYHFGKVSKLQYSSRRLSPVQGGYSYENPAQSIPKIIATSSGSNNIEAIKSYFTDEQVIRSIAGLTGMDFDVLVGGDYKLLLEPIAYFKFEGVDIAVTATESALYDEQLGGGLRSKMASLSHKNLPLAMFLEVGDLGYPAWSGSRSNAASNAEIKSSLGLGIVRFQEQPEPPQLETYDYEYRVDTEVITSVWVSGGQSDPDYPTTVTFTIKGTGYNVSNVYYPDGDSQLVWVRWRTPDTPCEMTIGVTVSGPGAPTQGTINVKVVDLDKNPPPNPVADDRNDSFVQVSVPTRPQNTAANWGVWRPWWQEYWVWIPDWDWCDHGDTGHWVDNGWWEDHGWWEFDFDRYRADLTGDMSIKTDEHNPTASGRTMKSGYGVNQTVTATVSSNQSSAVTPAQNAVSYFCEFGYEQFWRLLECTTGGNSSEFTFKENNYSTYKNRTHFTPIWMPDGAYTVNTWIIDSWTPTGMLSMNLTDSLTIRGSLWDDWHVAPLNPK